MTKAPSGPDQQILSGSRALDGVSENAVSIPAVDTPAIRRSDSGNGNIDACERPQFKGASVSRRSVMNMIVQSAALAAAAPIATVETAALPSGVPAAGTPPTQTLIGRLWAQREAVRGEYKAASKFRRKLERQLKRRLPQPDSSIVFSAVNDVDGLRNPSVSGPPRFYPHIWPQHIERALWQLMSTHVENAILSADQAPLRARLTARLDLSRRYEAEITRIKKQLGLAALEKKIDKLCNRQIALEDQILASRSTLRSDLTIKLAIYDDQRGYESCAADSIIRDLRKLVGEPAAFEQAEAEI
jgi:hypothetical protein